MKITEPAREVDVCDLCRSHSYLQDCDVCGKQFCLSCEGTVPQSWGFTQICRGCAERDDVKAICERYAEQLTPIYARRRSALKRLRTKAARKAAGGGT